MITTSFVWACRFLYILFLQFDEEDIKALVQVVAFASSCNLEVLKGLDSEPFVLKSIYWLLSVGLAKPTAVANDLGATIC